MNPRISVDKIHVTLRATLPKNINSLKFDRLLAAYGCGYEIFKTETYCSQKPFSYKHFIELWDGKGSKMNLRLFRLSLSGKYDPYCEFCFNPNKHDDNFPAVLKVLEYFGFTRIVEINRVDVSVDFPLSPFDIELACSRPIQEYISSGEQYTRYKTYSDKTMMRIYNKAVEEGFKGDLTRCELVLKNWIANKQSNFDTISRHFDDIFYRDISMNGVEFALNLPHYIAYAVRNIPSCKLRDFIPMLSSKYKDEAQRYYQARYKRYNFTIDDYFYICKLLQLYLPMLKESEV